MGPGSTWEETKVRYVPIMSSACSCLGKAINEPIAVTWGGLTASSQDGNDDGPYHSVDGGKA